VGLAPMRGQGWFPSVAYVSISDEIRASAAAHRDLGPLYEGAVAEGLVERIGEEIDRRINVRLGTASATTASANATAVNTAMASLAAARGRRARARALAALAIAQAGGPTAQAQAQVAENSSRLGFAHVALALGSMILAMAATGILVSGDHGEHTSAVLVGFVWAVIAAINIAYARRR
jgi:hypothetical protein